MLKEKVPCDDDFFEAVEERDEKIKLIGLILDSYVGINTEEKCGKRFDLLYDKSLVQLKAYWQVYGNK